MKTSLLLTLLSVLLLTGCGGGGDEGEGGGGGDIDPPDPGSYTIESHTVFFYNATYHATIDDTKYESFKEWFNGDKDYLASLETEGLVQINGIYGEDAKYILSLGSQKNIGKMSFEFKYKLYSISVNCEPYSKYISNTGAWNIDKASKLYVNDKEVDLSTDATTLDEIDSTWKTLEWKTNISDAPNTLTLETKEVGKRVFITSLNCMFYVPKAS